MKQLILVFSICSLLFVSCTKELNSGYQKGTAQYELATFLQNINSAQYEAALLQFDLNPIEHDEITIDEYISFVNDRITKNNSISSIEMTETPEEFDPNTVRIDVNFTYNDGSSQKLWVNMKKVDEIWKVTTRGSMF